MKFRNETNNHKNQLPVHINIIYWILSVENVQKLLFFHHREKAEKRHIKMWVYTDSTSVHIYINSHKVSKHSNNIEFTIKISLFLIQQKKNIVY